MKLRYLALGLAASLVGTAILAGSHARAAGARPLPTKDSFYRYSGAKPLASVAPGTVLKKRTVEVALEGNGAPIAADQLLYRTRDEMGHPAVTVTTVLQPATASVVPQIVSYLSFYDALGSECDPSYTLPGGDAGNSGNQQQADEEEALIAQFLASGDIVTVPDFEGTRLDWAAGQEAGWSTLDAIRATESDLKLPVASKVALTGYSGGSIAADWASELAPRYAGKLNIVGVAEGGIPVDMAHNTTYINGSKDWSGVIPAVLVSLTRAFHLRLHHYLSPYGVKITDQVRDECIGSFLGSYPHLKVQQLLKHRYRHFLEVPTFRRIANHLIMGRVPGHPKGPLFMAVGDADGTGDGVMVTKDVEALAHEYCKQGVPLQFTVYNGQDHDGAGEQFELGASQQFLAERFAGTPFSNGCSSVGKGHSLAPLRAPKHHRHHHHQHHKHHK
jgi:hypothetical protein